MTSRSHHVTGELDMQQVEAAARRLEKRYGAKEAKDWASHFAYNNYEPGDYGYRYWRAVADHIGSVESNPIPPPPHGGRIPTHSSDPAGTKRAEQANWFFRTFPVGTPVKFRRGMQVGRWSIPDGVKGEVVEQLPREVRIRFFPPLPGDPRFKVIEEQLEKEARRRGVGARAVGVEDLDIFVSLDGAMSGLIEPLEDTWGAPPGRTSRHRLPQSQRSSLKPNSAELTSRNSLRANKRARPLKGAAMDTDFGADVENMDDIGGSRGRQLDAAMDRYETFHAKAPIRVAELDHEIPKSWTAVGDALAVMYRTDKWKKDGSDIDYKHLHDKNEDKPYEFKKGVRFFEPASEARKSTVRGRRTSRPSTARNQRLPVARPEVVTLLGYCLGVFVRRYDDEQIYEVNPRGCYLFSSPSGNMLLLYSADEQPDGSSGFLAAMAGGNLRVLKDGIDG